MCDWFIKHHGSGVHVADFLLKGHGFGLAGLMVLKGIVFGLFLPFFHHWMVLKGGAIMTYGLQVSSVPSVDSASWGPGSCRIIHILVFQSLYQSST